MWVHTRQRQQFGQPLAAFQALQHRMVDMYINLEQAISMTHMVTHMIGDDRERSRSASAAMVHIAQACRFIGQNAVQLHGAMGVTDELAVGRYFKRATVIQSCFGSADHHLRRFARLSR